MLPGVPGGAARWEKQPRQCRTSTRARGGCYLVCVNEKEPVAVPQIWEQHTLSQHRTCPSEREGSCLGLCWCSWPR